MSPLFTYNGKLLVVDGKLATNSNCCCGKCCKFVTWTFSTGECGGGETTLNTVEVEADCYSYFLWEDNDCVNGLVGRDCGDPNGQCNVYARVKVTGDTPGVIEYLQSAYGEEVVWGPEAPGGRCDCPNYFGSLSVTCGPCNCEPSECCMSNYDEEGNFLGTFSCEPDVEGNDCSCWIVIIVCASVEDCEQQPSYYWCQENTPNYQIPGDNGEARTFAYLQNAQAYADSLDMPDGCMATYAALHGPWPHYQDCVDQFYGFPDINTICCRGASEDAGGQLP